MATSLLDWILSILRDPDERAAFQADPGGYADDHGFGDLSAADVHDALCLIADNQSASYDHDNGYDNGYDNNGHVHYPPPKHYDNDDDAAHYLNNYITNEYTVVDDRDTYVDQSIHQDIDTDGGDFEQTIDNDPVIASGDGAVAAGGDIEDSTVTTGDGNVVGDNNQAVTGDDNTTAFGSGNASSADFDDA
ncbi:MAG: IniB N-terminal domain-containing protein, partial [Pseudonocardia sp.]